MPMTPTKRRMRRLGVHHDLRLFLLLLLCWWTESSATSTTTTHGNNKKKKKKIAVIGGGISGSLVTKYLVDYDTNCNQLESITIFEPYPVQETIKRTNNSSNHVDITDINITAATSMSEHPQSSRIASLELEDGSIVELGASVLYKGFYLVSDIIRSGGLEIAPRFSTGKVVDPDLNTGMGIYDGNGTWSILTTTAVPAILNKFQLAFRYSWDLVKLNKITKQALAKFAMVPSMLESTNPETFFDSPEDIWDLLGLSKAVHHSFDRLLDAVGVSSATSASSSSRWRRLLFRYQGSLRSELLDAVNLVNYNQDNTQVNGMVGLGSFAASAGGLFCVKGGNYQIIRSAYEQAVENRFRHCQQNGTIRTIQRRITTVVGDLEGLDLFSGTDKLGEYDIVILAVPLQHSKIQFLVQSSFDRAVVQPMPLAGLINAHGKKTDPDHDGHAQLPETAPESASRPYKQVVTTIVSKAVLNTTYFHLQEGTEPRSIAMTIKGKSATYNITAITQISSSGVYKIFSDERLSDRILQELFGTECLIEYVAFWGGRHGGATPDYHGQGTTTNFLLYDGAVGFSGHTSSGALYYPIAMEQSTLASLEIAATGAKAVAKLIAARVGLIAKRSQQPDHDEL
jgi:prenylcysteine oxidase / farnesylcysteine lyase